MIKDQADVNTRKQRKLLEQNRFVKDWLLYYITASRSKTSLTNFKRLHIFSISRL